MSEDEDGQSDLDEDEDTQDAINESLHDMSVHEKVDCLMRTTRSIAF